MVGWLLVGCCNAGDISDVTLAFGDAKAILNFPSEETDDKDDTDDTYDTDDTDDTDDTNETDDTDYTGDTDVTDNRLE